MRTRTALISLNPKQQSSADHWVASRSFPTRLRAALFGGLAGFLVGALFMLRYMPLPPFRHTVITIIAALFTFMLVAAITQVVFDGRAGSVRYVAGSPSTWFSQVRFIAPMTAWGFALCITTLCGYSIGVILLGLVQNDGNVFIAAPLSAWVIAIIGSPIAGFAWRSVAGTMHDTHGLGVAPDKLLFRFNQATVQLRWSHIASVRAGTMRKDAGRKGRTVPCVTIEASDGRVFNIEAFELGSDPNVVAAFIRHHRDHPQAREWLVDPEDAIRRFQDAQTQVHPNEQQPPQ